MDKLIQLVKNKVHFEIQQVLSTFFITLSSCFFGLCIVLQAKRLVLISDEKLLRNIFIVYSLIFPILAFIIEKIESSILNLNNGEYISNKLNRSLFLLFISLIFLFKVKTGVTVLLEIKTIVLFVLYRVSSLILNKEINLKVLPFNKSLKKYFPTYFFWFLLIYCFVYFYSDGSLNSFLWESGDFRHYKWLSDKFSILSSAKSYFPIGFPLILTPINVFSGTYYSRGFETVIELNKLSILLFSFIVWPLSIGLLQKSIVKLLNLKENVNNYTIVGVIIILFNIAYLLLPPPYTTTMDRSTHKVMVLGLVPAVEIINLLLVNFSIFALIFHKKVPYVLIGIITGLAAITKSTNIILIAIFYLSLFLFNKNKVRTLKSLFITMLIFSLQLWYASSEFNGGIFPGRQYQAEKYAHKEHWIQFINNTYGLQVDHVKLLDPIYISYNLKQFLMFYAIPIVITLLSSLFLLWKIKKFRQVWFFCVLSIVSFILVHTAFIRLGATFRYFHCLLSLFIILVTTSLVQLYNSIKTKQGMFS